MKVQLNARISEDLLKRLRERAEDETRTLSAVVELALEAYLKEEKYDGDS